ncbi:MAG: AMP-binding protein [Nitrospira sp. CR1.1]|jgi:long-chain acyl-CoA synthetase|nr:AMP-binding protein [Nitrospira sp. CR1.1]
MPRPWISRYDPGVCATSDYPEWTIPDLLRRSASRFPESPALFFYGTCMSFKELNDLSTRFALALRRLGVQTGDRVALMLPNIPQAVIAYYGVLKAGGVVTPTNPLYVEREIESQLSDAGSETIVALDLFYPRIHAIRERTHLPHRIVITSLKDFLPPLKRWLYPIKARWTKRWIVIEKQPPVHDFCDLIERETGEGAADTEPLPTLEPGALAQIQYTGGTTGTPKGVMLTHRNVVVNTLQGRFWCSNFREGKEVFLGAVPLFHCYGLNTCQNLAVATGSLIILLPRFHADEAVKAIEQHRVTIMSGVPMMFSMMTDVPQVGRYDLHSIRVCLCGASPLPSEVQAAFERLSGVKISEGYGLTEAGPTTHCNPIEGPHPAGSMGLPFPDTDARIVDVETGLKELPTGEAGELIVRGPQVMQGYWKKEADTQAVLRGGWLHTGDIVRRDEQGFFFFLDRKKDVIKPWGETVYPREVEEILFQHPAVREAVVVGIPDRHYGEAVKAFVVPVEGSSVTERELIEHCRMSLARFKVPVGIEFRSGLPRTIIGKVLRRALRDEGAVPVASTEAPRKAM